MTRTRRLTARMVAAIFVMIAVAVGPPPAPADAHEVEPVLECPDGYTPDADTGLCSQATVTTTYVAADEGCQAGFTGPSAGQCTRTIATETAAETFCPTGTLDGGRCITGSKAASASCPTGYSSTQLGGSPTCQQFYSGSQVCASGTLVVDPGTGQSLCLGGSSSPTVSCPGGFYTGSGLSCVRYANIAYSCSSGTLSGTRCITSVSASFRCASGTLGFSGGARVCRSTSTETRASMFSCTRGTLEGERCRIDSPGPTLTADYIQVCPASHRLSNGQCVHAAGGTIDGLPATGRGVAGTPWANNFTVSGAGSTASVSGTGCSLGTATFGLTSTAYTLTVTRTDAGTRTCTVTADNGAANVAVTVTFTAADAGTIDGLRSTGRQQTQSEWRDNFTVSGQGSTASVTGTGCSLTTATFNLANSAYTLVVTRASAGTRTCVVSADNGAADVTVTVTFTAPGVPIIEGLASAYEVELTPSPPRDAGTNVTAVRTFTILGASSVSVAPLRLDRRTSTGCAVSGPSNQEGTIYSLEASRSTAGDVA